MAVIPYYLLAFSFRGHVAIPGGLPQHVPDEERMAASHSSAGKTLNSTTRF